MPTKVLCLALCLNRRALKIQTDPQGDITSGLSCGVKSWLHPRLRRQFNVHSLYLSPHFSQATSSLNTLFLKSFSWIMNQQRPQVKSLNNQTFCLTRMQSSCLKHLSIWTTCSPMWISTVVCGSENHTLALRWSIKKCLMLT